MPSKNDFSVTDKQHLANNFQATVTVKSGGELIVDHLCSGMIVVEAGGEVTLTGDLTGTLIVQRGGTAFLYGKSFGSIVIKKGAHHSKSRSFDNHGTFDQE